MRRYLPIFAALAVLAIAAYVVIQTKNRQEVSESQVERQENIGTFRKQKSCAKLPEFLKKRKIAQPVLIDLSQKHFKGIALRYGKKLNQVLHPKFWERYGYFGTYTLDEEGNIYLAPMPFISIEPVTFNLQKNLYRLDGKTGELSIFMHFDDVAPGAANPYGITAVVYDCDDRTLWVSSIDKSDYQSQKGTIFHIDPRSKKVLEKTEGFDALTLQIVRSEKGKFLLAGSARDNGLYAFRVNNGTLDPSPVKLLELPSAGEHIRKIKVKSKNLLTLQAIPFSYTLIAQSAKEDRTVYRAFWNEKTGTWAVDIPTGK